MLDACTFCLFEDLNNFCTTVNLNLNKITIDGCM